MVRQNIFIDPQLDENLLNKRFVGLVDINCKITPKNRGEIIRGQPLLQKLDDECAKLEKGRSDLRRVNKTFAEGSSADKWTPYKYGASGERNRRGQRQFDCSGLCVFLSQASYNKVLPHSSRVMFNTLQPCKKPEPYKTLVFFKFGGQRHISHVGLYVGQGHIAHASRSRGKVVVEKLETFLNDFGNLQLVGYRNII